MPSRTRNGSKAKCPTVPKMYPHVYALNQNAVHHHPPKVNTHSVWENEKVSEPPPRNKTCCLWACAPPLPHAHPACPETCLRKGGTVVVGRKCSAAGHRHTPRPTGPLQLAENNGNNGLPGRRRTELGRVEGLHAPKSHCNAMPQPV